MPLRWAFLVFAMLFLPLFMLTHFQAGRKPVVINIDSEAAAAVSARHDPISAPSSLIVVEEKAIDDASITHLPPFQPPNMPPTYHPVVRLLPPAEAIEQPVWERNEDRNYLEEEEEGPIVESTFIPTRQTTSAPTHKPHQPATRSTRRRSSKRKRRPRYTRRPTTEPTYSSSSSSEQHELDGEANAKAKPNAKDEASQPLVVAANTATGAAANNTAMVENENEKEEEKKKKILVLVTGQSARDGRRRICTTRGMELQEMAAEAQRDNLFKPLHEQGYEVHVQVVTNHCRMRRSWRPKTFRRPYSWTRALEAMYKSKYVAEVWVNLGYSKNNRGEYIDKAIKTLVARDRRGLSRGKKSTRRLLIDLRRGARVKSEEVSSWSRNGTHFDRVILSRPDVIPLNPAHALAFVEAGEKEKGALERDTSPSNTSTRSSASNASNSNSNAAVVFPFKCEEPVWKRWKCVADIIIGMPSDFFFREFREGCLQRSGCFGEVNQPLPEGHQGYPNQSYHESINYLGMSGHSCQVCIEEIMGEAERPPIKYVLGDDYYATVNARRKWNPVFALNNG